MGKNRTKDESFILCLHAEAEKTGNLDTPFDRYHVGRCAGLQSRAVDTICKLLIKANFIKKSGETDIVLTPHGKKLIEQLHLE